MSAGTRSTLTPVAIREYREMCPALVTKSATSGALPCCSTPALTASSSIPFRLTTRRTTTLLSA